MKNVILTSMFFSMVTSLPVLATDTKQIEEDLAQPIRCETADADIRILRSEKAHTGEQIKAGVETIIPISLVYHLVKGTADDEFKIATGHYDKMLDKKIALIEAVCEM